MSERTSELVEALMSLVRHDSYQSEYDGRMYTLCPSCGDLDRGHADDCEFIKARQLLIEISGNPKLFDPPSPKPTAFPCQCGRTFREELDLWRHRKYSQKCKSRGAKATGDKQ